MELIKQNIHMDREKGNALTQITLEEDFNIPDQKRDVSSIHLEQGEVIFDEIKPFMGYVNVSGKLKFRILYHTKEEGCDLVDMEGAISFREKINLSEVSPSDQVDMWATIEDFNVSLINSRKISVQSLVSLSAKVEELYDLEVPVSIMEEETFEYCKSTYETSVIKVCKNDIWRIKEEISLPSNYPNMYHILWDSYSLHDLEYKVLEDRITLNGELGVFCMYEGEGDDYPVRTYETSVPFRGELECHGAMEGMIPRIHCKIAQKEMSIRPDLDGEERILGLEVVMDLGIKLYEEEEIDVVTDLYGIGMDVETKEKEFLLRRLRTNMEGKYKVAEEIEIPSNRGGILQLLHSMAEAEILSHEVLEEELRVNGLLNLKMLYITGEDENPYGDFKKQIPFSYVMEIPGLKKDDKIQLKCEMEQLRITISQGDKLDMKALLAIHAFVSEDICVNAVNEMKTYPIDSKKLSKLPAMAIYFVKPEDTLWKIGKQYYVPVEKIKSLNGLEEDELVPGQKLLIVKGTNKYNVH